MTAQLDGSSTRTGYAVFVAGRVTAAGYLLPDRSRDPALERIAAMADGLAALFCRHRPAEIVIEVSSGRRATHHGAGAGLTTYGMAVGALWHCATVLGLLPLTDGRLQPKVRPIPETLWTRGKPKAHRLRRTAAAHPELAQQLARDRGGDLADAVALGDWWILNGPSWRAAECARRIAARKRGK